MDTDEFIARASQIHGNKYDYSQTKYENAATKVAIGCPHHGIFHQIARNHIYGKRGCLECSGHKPHTTEGFIVSAREIHGDKYDYTQVDYLNNHTSVRIVCTQHGPFYQSWQSHISRAAGCPGCLLKYSTTEAFVRDAQHVHGARYSYTDVVYVDTNTPVLVRCLQHGPFPVTPTNHIRNSSGCPECSGRRMNTEMFRTKLYQRFPDFPHSLEKFDYVRAAKKATFVCRDHGDYQATPNMVLCGKGGCPKCVGQHKTTEEFLAELSLKQPQLCSLYDYTETSYQDTAHKIIVACSKHGQFKLLPSNHLRGQGCPKCNVSTGQLKVRLLLESFGINFEEEVTFPDLRGPQGKLYRFDFYLPDHVTVIEYDGLQHFQPVKWSSSWTDVQAQRELETIQLRDKIKTQYCLDHNIRLIRIAHDQDVQGRLTLELSLPGQ
jgi:hypothetical protein